MSASPTVDRAELVRRALVALVAERGFRGASMAAVAERAGVATGTAYVHYASKDALVLAAYREVKQDLGLAAGAVVIDGAMPPEERFHAMWHAIFRHLSRDPARARFLEQVDASPYRKVAHDAAMEGGDSALLGAIGADLSERFAELPATILYDLSIGPIVRLVATGTALTADELEALAESCWRAVTR